VKKTGKPSSRKMNKATIRKSGESSNKSKNAKSL
jgi:hypothetical protein